MTKEEIQKLEIFKIASPPSFYSTKQAEKWIEGLNFGVDSIIEKLLENLEDKEK